MTDELTKKIELDKNTSIINPYQYDKQIPEITYEKQELTVTDKKSVFLKISGENADKAYKNFIKVKKELNI